MPSYRFSFDRTPRPCKICGKKYKPASPMQKYCDKCRSKMPWGKSAGKLPKEV